MNDHFCWNIGLSGDDNLGYDNIKDGDFDEFYWTAIILTTGVNFINVQHTGFLYKRLFSSYVLALNELSYKKFACLKLMISTPGLNFINGKRAKFTHKRLFSSYVLALNELLYEKFAGLMLMKLTAGIISIGSK